MILYESMTYETILNSALAEIKGDVIKTEGSLVYNAVSALAYEVEKAYIQLDYLIKQMNPDTADYDGLVALLKQRGVSPADATKAVVKIEADAELPVGARFSLSSVNYVITEQNAAGWYIAECEDAGKKANTLTGELIPITYVEGLTSAQITELLIPGTDADGRNEVYEKYMRTFTESAFAGNVAAYKQKLESMDGIGGCKVYPVWNGAGTVKLVLIGSDNRALSDYLLQKTQEEVCPAPSTGYGFAPINHNCTCFSVKEVEVAISTSITFGSGYSWESCKEDIENAINAYLETLREAWADGTETDFIRVYISRMESAVLDVQGVEDIQNTTLNGAGSNLVLADDEIPVIGEVTVV